MDGHGKGSLPARRAFCKLAVAGLVAVATGSLLAWGHAEAQEPAKVTQQAVETLIAGWPATPQKVAKKMIEKHGPPDEATSTLLIWHDNGP